MQFNTRLTELLKRDPRFVDDNGELVIAAVQDSAWKIDHALVRLLLSDKDIKAKFFEEIEGHWIFNINTFIEYIAQKNFLDNSYTRFRNRIGLTIGGKYLRERGEVALVWPYKDCLLEGGQTKDEEKRKEIFFNEVLAQDEINRLLDPKVLTNFTRYTVKGKEKMTGFKRDENGVLRENLIVKGNNLLALHTLKQQFRGQVKLIYIDPPYNTGNDDFKYTDNFSHSAWLTFMKNRLDVARDLLSKEGSIWINIDDNEAHYLKVLCDDIFGRQNFIATIIWQKIFSPKGSARHISSSHDYILIYAYDSNTWTRNLQPRNQKHDERYKNPDNDPRGIWSSSDLSARNYYSLGIYPITTPSGRVISGPPKGTYWRVSKETFDELNLDNRIWWGEGKNNTPRLKRFLSEVQDGIVPQTIWEHKEVGNTQEAKKEIIALSDKEIFATPKPERLLKRIIEIATNPKEIILDFFIGSGTTSAVAHKMGRQYIGIEQMDYIETIPVERLKKVIGKEVHKPGELFSKLEFDDGGVSKAVNWQGGGEFVYCELMKYNQAFLERIQAAQDSEDLLDIWQEMAEGSFLNWYVNPQMPEEAINDFMALGRDDIPSTGDSPSTNSGSGLEKQKRLLVELLDKNQLFVNLTEIDDAQFKVSEEDKALNKAFYGDAR